MNKIDIEKGLSSREVAERIESGDVNTDETPKTKSIKEIIRDNFFNYFNFLNISLGAIVIAASILSGDLRHGLKNCLFMGVIFVNSIISIIEEVISKNIMDKLSLVGEKKATVVRDGEKQEIDVENLVRDDIVILSFGHQACADMKVISGEIEVNESLITGEADAVKKKTEDTVLSGSFVVSGTALGQVIHVGKENYAAKIVSDAKYKKDANSVVMDSFTKVLKMLSYFIIPIGIVMFIKEANISRDIPSSLFTTVASLIGMIPEGLVLLSSSVMAVGIVKLYRVKVLVQKLYSIETLARVDTICLDKTGTLTEGKMSFVDLVPVERKKDEVEKLLEKYVLASKDTNATMLALKEHFKNSEGGENYVDEILFSSDRKYSAIEFDEFSLYLGAPDILLKSELEMAKAYSEEYRVLAFCRKRGHLSSNFENLKLLGFILIEDVIRPSAKATLEYFRDNGVAVKIISGDNIDTVLSIARKVGLESIRGIDINDLDKEDVDRVVEEYQVFGRVKPEQKKWIIESLKKNGHTVAMTGDGVNDVLALKESDCAISVKSGTEAARNVSELILLNDDFNSLPRVVEEGRQIINNIERSASLLLVKTLYTVLLIIFSIVSLQKYFFIPIQLTFITTFTIGAPSFFLALEPNKALVKGNFVMHIFAKSLPIALTVLFNVILTSSFSWLFDLPYELQSSISVILTTMTGLLYLYKISVPFTKYRLTIFSVMTMGFLYCRIFQPEFFNLLPVSHVSILIIFVLSLDSILVYKILNYIITYIFHKKDETIEIESAII